MEGKDITSKTLLSIHKEAEKHFENTTYSQRDYDQWIIAKLSGKIIELEKIIQDRGK